MGDQTQLFWGWLMIAYVLGWLHRDLEQWYWDRKGYWTKNF